MANVTYEIVGDFILMKAGTTVLMKYKISKKDIHFDEEFEDNAY